MNKKTMIVILLAAFLLFSCENWENAMDSLGDTFGETDTLLGTWEIDRSGVVTQNRETLIFRTTTFEQKITDTVSSIVKINKGTYTVSTFGDDEITFIFTEKNGYTVQEPTPNYIKYEFRKDDHLWLCWDSDSGEYSKLK